MVPNKLQVKLNANCSDKVSDSANNANGANYCDTIVARATPPGIGGVGIIRLSGPLSLSIAQKILQILNPKDSLGSLDLLDSSNAIKAILRPRVAEYSAFLNTANEILDQGLALFFKGPNSFTGEDVLELQGHGSPVIIDQLIKTAVFHGARMARPGEFLERAFLNNKIDLAQAEAVHDLIHASSESAARAAMRSLQGEFSRKILALLEALITLRMFVEAAIDFPDEEIELLQEGEITKRLENLRGELETLFKEASHGALLSEGIRVVITGKPNAGKSSLMNAISGVDAAIVTDIPGTTRDVLRQDIVLDGLRLNLVDTAGLRRASDAIEQEGIKRAYNELKLADHIILVVDSNEFELLESGLKKAETEKEKYNRDKLEVNDLDMFRELHAYLLADIPITVLLNKIDACNLQKGIEEKQKKIKFMIDSISSKIVGNISESRVKFIPTSMKTLEGLEEFRDHLKKTSGFNSCEGNFTARRRHLESLKSAQNHLETAAKQINQRKGLEFTAEELRLAQLALDEITGKFSSDDLLGKIFGEFCIGK